MARGPAAGDAAAGDAAAGDVVLSGYVAGALGRVVEMHARYYHAEWGFDLFFESKVAGELAAFLDRYDAAKDLFRVALIDGRVVGSIVIDGGGPDDPDGARLRWFIVSPEARGRGAGKRLMNAAVDFARQAGLGRVHLWTFAGLDAAAGLYEAAGFELVEERDDDRWGKTVTEQKFVLEI